MTDGLLDLTLSVAVSYGNMSANVFNTFITVLFGSLAFASAKSLRHIGGPLKFIPWHMSSSSLMFGIALLCFYIISFISFRVFSTKAEQALALLESDLSNQKEIASLFKFTEKPIVIYGQSFGLPSIGFLIGATLGLVLFLWLANANRVDNQK